jgi:tetratricopeptide (TPR) repeat protein
MPLVLAGLLAACAGPGPAEPVAAVPGGRSASSGPPDILALLTAGAEALSADDPSVAAAFLDQAVAAGADDATTHFLRGLAHLQLGQLDEARDALSAAVERDPDDASARCVLARALHLAGDAPAALAQLDAALQLDPDDARLHTLAGHVALDLFDAQRALQELSRAIELDPRDADARRGLALLFGDVGDAPRAELAWREALRLRPDDAVLHSGLGHALRDQDRDEEALEAYAEALRLDPGGAVHHANLGSTLAALGRLPAARRSYEQAVAALPEGGPRRAWVLFGLALVLDSAGDLGAAREALQDALADDPGLAPAHEALGLLLLDGGEERGAHEHLAAALELGELSAEAACQLALLADRAGDGETALECAELLAAAAVDSPDVAFRRAQLLVAVRDPRLHDPAGALVILQDLLRRPGQQDSAPLWSLSAQALADLGQWEAALDAVDRALAGQEPGEPAWRRDRERRSEYLARLDER